jgi:hypothetical protein
MTTADAVDRLADALLNGDGDHLATLEPLRTLLAPSVFTELCHAVEVCPVHVCDAAICADDEAECPDGNGNPGGVA